MAFKNNKFTSNVTKVASYKSPVLQSAKDTLTDEEREQVESYGSEYPASLRDLIQIHTYARNHGEKAVDEFVERFITSRYADAQFIHNEAGKPMAVYICTDPESRTMFSAHVDTVHSYGGRQFVAYDDSMGLLMKPTNQRKGWGDCLGADDGAGVWLLLQMLEFGVKGTFVFHYGEEKGGIGSAYIAKAHSDFLQKFDRAIAFDRKGTQDVITHQGMGRCCSNEFAGALAAEINLQGSLTMRPDDGGIFTDTANYIDDIPECTNLSCGYESAHSDAEYLDVEFLYGLRDALVAVEWEALPTKRDPAVIEGWNYGFETSHKPTSLKNYAGDYIEMEVDEILGMKYGEMLKWVKTAHRAPEDIAEVLFEMKYRITALQDELHDTYAMVQQDEYVADEDDFKDLNDVSQW